MNAESASPAMVIDGLQYSVWDREVFEEMHAGGLTAAHVTLAIWEDARETLIVLGTWRELLRAHADLIIPCTSLEDIDAARATARTGIIFGFQNTSPFEDAVGFVEEFHRLGVRIAQLTYNIQNLAGSSCYEPTDGGLSRFGRNLVREMNRVGMVVDLSHVGNQTAQDAIDVSTAPVAVTHANPSSFFAHPRNKPDDLLRSLADHGGMIGVTPYPHLVGDQVEVEQWAGMVARTVDLMGIDHVGIGSDMSRKWSDEYLMWIRMGRWTRAPDYGAGTAKQAGWAQWPAWFETPAGFPNMLAGLAKAGFSDEEVRKIVGENWRNFFARTWVSGAGREG